MVDPMGLGGGHGKCDDNNNIFTIIIIIFLIMLLCGGGKGFRLFGED